jgi:hypothetical protein
MYTHFVRTYGANAYFIDNYLSDSYTKMANDVGMAVITVPANHPAVTGLALDDVIEIFRGNNYPDNALPYYADWTGFFRGVTYRSVGGMDVADIFAWHENEVLRRAISAYPAGVSGTSQFNGYTATTVMNVQISDNFASKTASFIGTPRIAQATSKFVASGSISVPSSTTADFSTGGRTVLATLQELAELDQSVFVVKRSGSNWLVYIARNTFATDRRADTVFDVRRENVNSVELDARKVGETTVAIVAGVGDGASRPYVTRFSPDHDYATNHYEMFIDGRGLASTAALEAYGDAFINRSKARPLMRFTPVQLPYFSYGRNYFFGDIVTCRYGDQELVQRIMSVSVTYGSQGETVQLGLENLP